MPFPSRTGEIIPIGFSESPQASDTIELLKNDRDGGGLQWFQQDEDFRPSRWSAPARGLLCSFEAPARTMLGHELTETRFEVLALERAKFRDTVPESATTHTPPDELRHAVRHALTMR